MKYCTNCGEKLSKDDKFCTGCGGKVINEETTEIVEKKKEESDFNSQKLILILGVFLVLFASFIFGVFSWKELSPEFRISFFAFETVLFFGLSFVLKKANTKLDRLFFIIGLVMIPYVLSLVPYYGLISSFIASGTGLYVYLAICYLFTGLIYVLINAKYKSKVVTVLYLLAFLLSLVCFGLAISNKIEFILLYVIILLTIVHLSSYISSINEGLRKVLYYFGIIGIHTITLFMFIVFLSSYVDKSNFSILINAISLALFIINLLVNNYINKNTGFMYATPILVGFLTYNYFINAFTDLKIILYVTSLIIIFIHYVSYLINEKSKYVSVITTYCELVFGLFIILVSSLFDKADLVGPFIMSSILLGFSIFNILVHKFKVLAYIIPINVVFTALFLFRWLGNIQISTIFIIISSIFILLYAVFKLINKKLSYAYLITGGTTLIIATSLLTNFGLNVNNIMVLVLFALVYFLSLIFKEEDYISIPAFVFLNIAIVKLVPIKEIYYALLAISAGVIIIGSLIGLLYKDSKRKIVPYLFYGQILLLVISLFNMMNHPWYILSMHTVLLILGLLSLIKFNNHRAYRITYTAISLLFIVRFIDFVIEPDILSTIVCFSVVIVLLVSLYLADVEDATALVFMSLVLLFPYYNLLFALGYPLNELFLFPLVLYTMLITSIVRFKDENNRKIATIIPLSIITYFFVLLAYRNMLGNISSVIYDIILAAVYIIFGLIRKYNFFIILGVILTLVTIFIRLWTVINSIIIIFILIALGFALIGIALYLDLHKKKD